LYKKTLTIILIAACAGMLHAQPDYHLLHQQSLVVDTHADVLLQVKRGADISKRLDYGHIDLLRLKEGGVDVQFFAVWPNPDSYQQTGMYDQAMQLIDLLESILKNNPDKIMLARSPGEIMTAVSANKIAACIGIEGGTAIENDLEKLRHLYKRGARYLGLTWNDSPDWASAAKDEISTEYSGHHGLTDFGKEVIRTMNQLGMIIDVDHMSVNTRSEVLDIAMQSDYPVVAGHAGLTTALTGENPKLDEAMLEPRLVTSLTL